MNVLSSSGIFTEVATDDGLEGASLSGRVGPCRRGRRAYGQACYTPLAER